MKSKTKDKPRHILVLWKTVLLAIVHRGCDESICVSIKRLFNSGRVSEAEFNMLMENLMENKPKEILCPAGYRHWWALNENGKICRIRFISGLMEKMQAKNTVEGVLRTVLNTLMPNQGICITLASLYFDGYISLDMMAKVKDYIRSRKPSARNRYKKFYCRDPFITPYWWPVNERYMAVRKAYLRALIKELKNTKTGGKNGRK